MSTASATVSETEHLNKVAKQLETDLRSNRKTQEQLALAFSLLLSNFKSLKTEKIIKIDIYQKNVYDIEKILKVLKEYKIEELSLVKKIKQIEKKKEFDHIKPKIKIKKEDAKIYEISNYKRKN